MRGPRLGRCSSFSRSLKVSLQLVGALRRILGGYLCLLLELDRTLQDIRGVLLEPRRRLQLGLDLVVLRHERGEALLHFEELELFLTEVVAERQ